VRRPIALLIRIAVALVIVLVVLPAALILVCRWVPPPVTSFMIHRRIAAWAGGEKDYELRYHWTPWEKISPHARVAVVAAEDQKFPFHSGFDVQAIEAALDASERGERLRGASTISQQVAKNLFLWPGRSFVRKGLEAHLTVLIELIWSKRRVLEVYLNAAEMGPGVFGVGAASRVYFDKSPEALTRYEAAVLAAVLPNPLRLRADRPSHYVRARVDWILRQVTRLGGSDYLRNL
jgi:monofunctional biosynthetic peptidoglycan transglycosylase